MEGDASDVVIRNCQGDGASLMGRKEGVLRPALDLKRRDAEVVRLKRSDALRKRCTNWTWLIRHAKGRRAKFGLQIQDEVFLNLIQLAERFGRVEKRCRGVRRPRSSFAH